MGKSQTPIERALEEDVADKLDQIEDTLESVGTDETRSTLYTNASGNTTALLSAQLDNSVGLNEEGLVTHMSRALQGVSQDQLRVDLVNDNLGTDLDVDINSQSLGGVTTNLNQVGGTAQSGVDVADKLDQIEDTLESVGTDETRSTLYTNGSGSTTALLSAQLDTSVGVNQEGLVTHMSRALQAVGQDQLQVDLENNNAGTLAVEQQTPVGIENEAGEQIDPDSADAAYANATTLTGGGESTFTLVARGGDDIVGRVQSQGQYDIEARYEDDAGNTIFTETVVSNITGGTTTQLGPNDTVVDPASDHVTIAVLDDSGSNQSLDVVLHYN